MERDEGFAAFVLRRLPPPPARVVEIGCGEEGGLVPELTSAGYDVLGVDPVAPEGDRYLRVPFERAELAGGWDAVVAGRVLHHVEPLDEGLDLLAGLAPLLLVDEFAPDLVRGAAQAWYERERQRLLDAGENPAAPEDIDAWRARHEHELHPHDRLLAALRERWQERELQWLPYFHRWLRAASTEAAERAAIAAGEIPPIGWRWAGTARVRPYGA